MPGIVINGSPITFHSSGGVHLVGFGLRVRNENVAAGLFQAVPRLDGVEVVTVIPSMVLASTFHGYLTGTYLLEIPVGTHTLDVAVIGIADGGDVVQANTGHIFAIEFPSWETSDRIEGP